MTIQFFKAMSTQMEQRHHRSEAFDPEGLVTVGSSPRSFLFTSATFAVRLRRREAAKNNPTFDDPLFKTGAVKLCSLTEIAPKSPLYM